MVYTKGKEGNPSQKLSDMLKYIEKTTNNNVTGSPTAASGGGTLAAVAKCTCKHVHLARCSQESRHRVHSAACGKSEAKEGGWH